MLLIPFSGPMSTSCCLQNTCVVRGLSWPPQKSVEAVRCSSDSSKLFFFIYHISLIWAFVYVTAPATAHAASWMSSGKAEAIQKSKEQVQQVGCQLFRIRLLFFDSILCIFFFFFYYSHIMCQQMWFWLRISSSHLRLTNLAWGQWILTAYGREAEESDSDS